MSLDIEPSPRIEAGLNTIPGAVMRKTGNLILTFIIGAGTIWLLRTVV